MFIAKKYIARRTFLKGAGVTVALPLLDAMLPALNTFRPELVFISAGFDAHQDDPLGQMRLVEADYAWATDMLCGVAARQAWRETAQRAFTRILNG